MTNDLTFWRLFTAALVIFGACVAVAALLLLLLKAVV